MTKPRKLWAVRFRFTGAPIRRHESKAAAYRHVQNEVANWLAGTLRTQHLAVWVDERDGRGWQTYEFVDLAELAEGLPS